MFKPKKILVPTDFSDCGGQCSMIAVKQAIEIAAQNKSELFFLHVIPDEIRNKHLFYLDDDKIDILDKSMRKNASEELISMIKGLGLDESLKYNLTVREGVAYDEILKESKKIEADLICIGTRGLSGLKGFLAGSTTEKVVRYATCNVLIAKKPMHD